MNINRYTNIPIQIPLIQLNTYLTPEGKGINPITIDKEKNMYTPIYIGAFNFGKIRLSH